MNTPNSNVPAPRTGTTEPVLAQGETPVFVADEFKETFDQVKECIMADREEALDAYHNMKEQVLNSSAIDVSQETRTQLAQLLNVVNNFDDKLVKMVDIMADFVRPKKVTVRASTIKNQPQQTTNNVIVTNRRDLLSQVEKVMVQVQDTNQEEEPVEAEVEKPSSGQE